MKSTDKKCYNVEEMQYSQAPRGYFDAVVGGRDAVVGVSNIWPTTATIRITCIPGPCIKHMIFSWKIVVWFTAKENSLYIGLSVDWITKK